MIASPHAPLSRRGSSKGTVDAHAGMRQRCPFLQQVGEGQAMPLERIRPPSPWASEADARAGEVLQAFARHGGLASGNELLVMLRRRTSQPVSMLARWIVERRVVHFAWQGEYLLPMFQFERADMGVREAVAAVLEEFDSAFDGWDLTTWFALPSGWLAGAAPVDVIDHQPDAVRQAARADRFVARG